MTKVKIVLTSMAGVAAFGFVAGCKVTACPETQTIDGGKQVNQDNCLLFQSTEQFTGDPRTVSGAWSSGKNVNVTSANGDVNIVSDAAQGEVRVDGTPFTRDVKDQANNAYARLAARPSPALTTDTAGNVGIDSPYQGFDGYHLTVHLPAGFDGVLSASTNNGSLGYQGTLTTAGNALHSGNGDVTARIGAASKITASGTTELGVIVFRGPWMSPTVASDQKSGTAQLGDGSGSLRATTGLGDVFFDIQ
jgi:hypothetical protein